MTDNTLEKNPFEGRTLYEAGLTFADTEELANQLRDDNGLDDLAVDLWLIGFGMTRILDRCPDQYTRLLTNMNIATHVAQFKSEDNQNEK